VLVDGDVEGNLRKAKKSAAHHLPDETSPWITDSSSRIAAMIKTNN